VVRQLRVAKRRLSHSIGIKPLYQETDPIMAKRILLAVLQDYFGRYIDGLNEENLRVAVWRGEIDLDGLEVKKALFEGLRLPLEVVCGHIHKFKVSVPWSKLASEPVKVTIDGVYLLTRTSTSPSGAPKTPNTNEDAAQEGWTNPGKADGDHRQKESKRPKKQIPRRIVEKRIRLRWANLISAGTSGKEESNTDQQGFWARLGAKIMDNIQINVTNVHVRLEDCLNIKGKTFAVGLTFEEFLAVTSDENGNQIFLEKKVGIEKVIHKSVELRSLGVYCDAAHEMICSSEKMESDYVYQLARGIWREQLQETLASKNKALDERLRYRDLHHFLLSPCSPSMLITRNQSADFSKPRYKIEVKFLAVQALLSKAQFSIISTLHRAYVQNSVLSVYREHRPEDAPLENARAWWKYAYVCVKIHNAAKKLSQTASLDESEEGSKLLMLTKRKQEMEWTHVVNQVLLRSRYITLYKKLLWMQTEEDHQKKISSDAYKTLAVDLQEIEDELEVENTLAYRAAALAEMEAERKKQEANASAATAPASKSGWLAGWFAQQEAANVGNDDEDEKKEIGRPGRISLTPEERAEIIDAVNFFEEVQNHTIPDRTVHLHIKSNLRLGSVALVNSDYSQIMYRAEISGRHVLETRFGNSWKHQFVLKTLTLRSQEPSSESTQIPRGLILSPKYDAQLDSETDVAGNAVVLTADYTPPERDHETKVAIRSEIYKVRIAAVPFKIIAIPDWMNGFAKFFYSRGFTYSEFDSAMSIAKPVSSRTLLAEEEERPFTLVSPTMDPEDAPSFDQTFNAEVNWVADYVERSAEASRRIEEAIAQSMLGSRLKPAFDLHINISAPILILPGPLRVNKKARESALVLDLGHITVMRNDIKKSSMENNAQQRRRQVSRTSSIVVEADDEGDSNFFSAVEDEFDGRVDDLSSLKRTMGEAKGMTLQPSVSEREIEGEDEDDDDNLGMWNVDIRRIRSAVIVLDGSTEWDLLLTMYTAKEDIPPDTLFHVVEDFDVQVALTHLMSSKYSPRIDVQIGSMTADIVPTYVLFLWELRNLWVQEKWWWLSIEEVSIDDEAFGRIPEGLQPMKTSAFGVHYTFEAESILVNVSADQIMDDDAQESRFLSFFFRGLATQYIQRARGFYAHLELEGFDVVDRFAEFGRSQSFSSASQNIDYFATSGNDAGESLILVDARWRRDEEKETVLYVVAKFHKLWVSWNPDTIAALRLLYARRFRRALSKTGSHNNVIKEKSGVAVLQVASSLKYVAVVSLASLTVSLRKKNKTLVELAMTKATAKATQGKSSFRANGELGNLLVMARERNMFSVSSQDSSLVKFAFFSDFEKNSEFFSCRISASRYVHLNLLYLEVYDYVQEGILRALFGEKINFMESAEGAIKDAMRDEGDEGQARSFHFEFDMQALEVMIPVSHDDVDDESGIIATCSDLNASSKTCDFGKGNELKTTVELSKFSLCTKQGMILEDPVRLVIDVSHLSEDQGGLVVECQISDVMLVLALKQYWLIQAVFSYNLLADPISDQSEKNPEDLHLFSSSEDEIGTEMEDWQEQVSPGIIAYAYDNLDEDEGGLVFKLTVELRRASLTIADGEKVTDETAISIFSMEKFKCEIARAQPEAFTALEIRVAALDLIDKRESTRGHHLNMLIEFNRDAGADLAFFFRYVHCERVVELDLFNFRSFLKIDLLSQVISFWTSSDPEDGQNLALLERFNNAPLQSFEAMHNEVGEHSSVSAANAEILCNWKGSFKLVDPYVCLVPDFEDLDARIIVIRCNTSFTWERSGNPTQRQFSYWTGSLNSVQAYVACFDRETASSLAQLQERALQQLMEPTDLNFSYEYEEVALRSKVHSRRVQFMFNQLDIYGSMEDFALADAILQNVQTSAEERKKEAAASALPDTPSSRGSSATQILVNDQDYVEFVVPEGTKDVGIILQQDRGFLRVHNLYEPRDGQSNPCQQFGIKPGDYLLSLDGVVVCNESPDIAQERLLTHRTPFKIKFLRGGSDGPVVLQDSLNVQTQKVILNLIDDLDDGDMPLSNLVLARIDVFLNGTNDGNYTCGAQLEMIGAHFFDLRAGSWGVLLDPGFINFSSTLNSGELDITIDIPEPIGCNLSDTFLRVISNSLSRPGADPTRKLMSRKAIKKRLANVYSKQKESRTDTQSENKAFLLSNETGMNLKFCKVDDHMRNTSEEVVVEPGEEEQFGFLHYSGTGHGILRGFCQYESLSIMFLHDFNDDGSLHAVWEPLEGVVVNKIGGGVARLVPKRKYAEIVSPNGLRIKWSVDIDDNTRKLKLALSSLFCVENVLDYGIRVLANSPVWHEARILPEIIEPGKAVWLPVLFGDATQIRVQPLLPEHIDAHSHHEYDWSGPINTSLGMQGSIGSTDLECNIANGKTRFLCASVQPGEDAITTVFSVHPQIRFRNLLPQAIDYQEHLPDISEDMPIGGGRIMSGEEVQLHSLTSNRSGQLSRGSRLVMKLGYSLWSEPVSIETQRFKKKNMSLSARTPAEYRKISFLRNRPKTSRQGSSSTITSEGIHSQVSNASVRTIDEDDEEEDGEDDRQVECDEDDYCDVDSDEEVIDLINSSFKPAAVSSRKTGASSSDESDVSSAALAQKSKRVHFQDLDGNSIDICVECKEAEAGGVLVVVYAEYWIINYTTMPLRYGPESGDSNWVRPCALNMAEERHSIMMFNPVDNKIRVGFEAAISTEATDVSTPGMNEHLFLPNDSRGSMSLNLGVTVDVGPGLLHRTNMISITPRFTFSNFTGCDLCVRRVYRPMRKDMPQMWVEVGRSLPYWAESSPAAPEKEPAFQIRFGAKRVIGQVEPGDDKKIEPTEWSEAFNVNKILELRRPGSVRLRRGKFYEFYQFEVQIGDTAGSIIVEFSERGMEQLREREGDGPRRYGPFARFPLVRMTFSLGSAELQLLRDQTDLTVFHRGLKRARKDRTNRILAKAGNRRLPMKSNRPEPVLSLTVVKIEARYFLDHIIDSFDIVCQTLRLQDSAFKPTFGIVLYGTGGSIGARSSTGPEAQRQRSFLRFHLKRRRGSPSGTLELEDVRLNFGSMEVGLSEEFLLDLLSFVVNVLDRNAHSIRQLESGSESVQLVFGWEENGQVAKAARAWAEKQQRKLELEARSSGKTTSLPWTRSSASLSGSSQQQQGHSSATSIVMVKLKQLVISKINFVLSYQQHPDKSKSSVLYDLGGGLLSRMNIRVDKAKLSLGVYEKSNFTGSPATLAGAVQHYYQAEVSKSMLGLLRAVSFSTTNFGIGAAIRDKFSFTSAKIRSDEFPTRSYRSGEEILAIYGQRLRPDKGCMSVDAFVTLLRNFVFDWRNTHRFLYGRKLCVVGVVNRSSKPIQVEKPVSHRMGKSYVVVPHTLSGRGNTRSMLDEWRSGKEWNEGGYTAWMCVSKLKESVTLESSNSAFRIKVTVPGEISILAQQGFNVAFLHRDAQNSNALYVIAIEDKIQSFRR